MDQCYNNGTKRLLISVDRNSYTENINLTSPTKYYEEAHNCMVGVRLYIYNKHGD